MSLFIGEHSEEFLEIGDASAMKKIKKFFITLTWLYNVDQMFSLRPSDTSDISKLTDERNVSDNIIHQLTTISSQLACPSFV